MGSKILMEKPFEVYVTYYNKYLMNFLQNLFKWNGMPETVDTRFFNYKLLTEGFAPVYKYNMQGEDKVICTDGALSGLDWYMRPIKFQSCNPILKSVTRQVSYKDNVKEDGCVVFYNTINGIKVRETMNEMVAVYAYKLANLAISEDTSIMNSRVCVIPVVGDVEEAQRVTNTLREMYQGKPATLSYRNGFGNGEFQIVPIKAKDNIVTMELQDARNNVIKCFLSELGVDCLALDKKERTNYAEMDSNNQQLKITSDIYLKPRELGCEEMNATFGTNVSVEINEEAIKSLMEGVGTNVGQGQTPMDNESDT